jgi:tRNA (guanine37-N1)-methyltransferase
MRRISIISIHPEFISSYSSFGVVRSAREQGLAQIKSVNLRDYSEGKYRRVDDVPFGGGESMVMLAEPLAKAVRSLTAEYGEKPLVILTSPAGKTWTHADAATLAASPRPVVIVCGRFAGVDQRFIDHYVDVEYSFGDFVVSGGELPALMLVDSVLRLIPGVLGDQKSATCDSFAAGFAGQLEHPVYTRPPVFEGMSVPDVLLSGHHGKIEAWRQEESLKRTRVRRPDLLKNK